MFGISEDIWNGYTKKEKVYVFCKKLHILKAAQFVNRKVLGNEPAETPYEVDNELEAWTRMSSIFVDAKRQFYSDIPSKKRKVVFSGHILEFDKGTCSYLNDMASVLDDTEILLLSHATKQNFAKTNSLIDLKYFSLPFTFGLNRYEVGIDVAVPEEARKVIQEKDYLTIHEEKIRMRHKDMGVGYPMALTYFLYEYYCEFLDYYKPDAVILWCEFYCGHNILRDICKERGIKVLYMEFGALPGTLALECNGQMGESDVATKWGNFKEKDVSQDEIMTAKEVLKYLRETGLNRRVQVKTNILEKFREKYNPGRPIVVMFGQNDYEAGIKPYTDNSKNYHSPIFKGSDDAALFVERLALKNNWNYIYKPHQMMVRVGECLEDSFSKKTTWVGDSDINELIDIADVVITIVSQCGYVSLIREKPTVMLGYTQLRGKDCTYEPTCKEDVEKVIKEAIQNGYTQTQREAFEKHTAQLMKYYLFDDRLPKKYTIGRSHEEAVQFVNTNVEFPKEKLYPKRKVLFLCRNEYEIQGAIILKTSFNSQTEVDIAVVTRKNIDAKKVKRYIEWNAFIIKNEIEELYDAIGEQEYSDLYVAGYETEHIDLFEKMKEINENLIVHIYDGGDIRLYLKDIDKDMNNRMFKSFFAAVSEIFMYDKEFMVWKDKANIKIYNMPKADMKYIRDILKCKHKKIYADSWLMNEGYVSNELDLLKNVGDTNDIVVVPYSENSQELYQNEGYFTLGNEDERFNEPKVICSSLFNTVYFWMSKNMGYRYIDLSNLLSTGNILLTSNTYKKFLEICDKKKYESTGYYLPTSQKELQYIMQCFDVE